MDIVAEIVRTGYHGRMGAWVVVRINGNIAVITEQRFGVSTPQILVDCEFSLDALPPTLVVKSGYLFEPWKVFLEVYHGFELLLSTEGSTSLDLSTFPYHRVPLDIFPLSRSISESWNMVEFDVKGRAPLSRSRISLG